MSRYPDRRVPAATIGMVPRSTLRKVPLPARVGPTTLPDEAEQLLKPREAAALIPNATHESLGRYGWGGRLVAVRTLGGQRRFRLSDVLALLAAGKSGGAE